MGQRNSRAVETTSTDIAESTVDSKLDESFEKSGTGEVTTYNGSFGQIDNEIFFLHDVLEENFVPKERQIVSYDAKRKSKYDGWTATFVGPADLAYDSDKEFEIDEGEKIVTLVLGVERTFGNICYLNRALNFQAALCKDFKPEKGDMLKVVADLKRNEVCSVEPLRTYSFATSLKHVSHSKRFAFTREDVYFDFQTWESCNNKDFPRVGDFAYCTAIETSRGNCLWRAIKIVKIYTDKMSNAEITNL